MSNNKAYTIELAEDTESIRFTEYERTMKELLKKRAITAKQLIDLDAEVNGGALVPIATVLGKTLYIRVDHHDPELARQQIKETQSIVKDVVLGEL